MHLRVVPALAVLALVAVVDEATRHIQTVAFSYVLVAAGFLDNLCLEAEGRRILVKGRTTKEMVMVEDAPEKEVHRERLKTTVVALGLDDGEIIDIAA